MLRLVGSRLGPVLMTGPVFGTKADDSVAEALHWEDEMQGRGPEPAVDHAGAERRRSRRFRREEPRTPAAPPHSVQH